MSRYKVGDKVVVLSKTIGDIIEESVNIKNAKEYGQSFLYVAETDVVAYGESNILTLSSEPYGRGGDYFRESDVNPYVETEPKDYIIPTPPSGITVTIELDSNLLEISSDGITIKADSIIFK